MSPTGPHAIGGELGDCTVAVAFAGTQAVLAFRGEMDLLTAPRLGTFFDGVIAAGSHSVVLDLAECAFLDASGLRVIAKAAARVGASGGELTIRSPSAMVVRILGITGLDRVVRLEHSRPLREVEASPAADDMLDSALHLVVALASATLSGADGVSVSLRRHGRLATVAATDQTIVDMDANQYATGEGPCLDASVDGRWFHARSLDTETRWPAFTPRALSLGINAILSSPLLAQGEPVGALNIYSRTADAFAPKDQELAAMFASEASTILASAGADRTEGQPSATATGSPTIVAPVELADRVRG